VEYRKQRKKQRGAIQAYLRNAAEHARRIALLAQWTTRASR